MPVSTSPTLVETQTDSVPESPYCLVTATATTVTQPSPSFVRVTFRGPGIDQMGTLGHTFDQRIKVLFPSEDGTLPALDGSGDEWYPMWLNLPVDRRGTIRTYSIRDLTVDEAGTTDLVIDFVLHLAEGETGPAARWAEQAKPGDQVLIVGPRRGRFDGGGIEFEPADGQAIILAGDETAAPAIARILEDVPRSTTGVAFIEVPLPADTLMINQPEGVSIVWLPRSGADHGALLGPAVSDYLRSTRASGGVQGNPSVLNTEAGSGVHPEFEPELVTAEEADPDAPLVWETPGYSGAGEAVDEADLTETYEQYFWIAGESKVVTDLRRHLVRDLGIARAQVAFMGYWRHGVAMKG